jgi:HSP20 family protein
MALKELIPWKRTGNELATRQDSMFAPFDQFRREMDNIFDGFLTDWPMRSTNLLDRQLRNFMPQVDVTETEKEVRVIAELPGLEEKDVDVSLTQGVLTIKGEKREEHEENKRDFHRSELRYGMFERAVQLPAEIDADKAKATFKKGVLKITLPKTAEAQSNRRRIPVEG